jgi:hypothetical protein
MLPHLSVEAARALQKRSAALAMRVASDQKSVARVHARIGAQEILISLRSQSRHMQSIDPIEARGAELVKIAESTQDKAALQHHLTEIIN